MPLLEEIPTELPEPPSDCPDYWNIFEKVKHSFENIAGGKLSRIMEDVRTEIKNQRVEFDFGKDTLEELVWKKNGNYIVTITKLVDI